jgi:hypothetical protein
MDFGDLAISDDGSHKDMTFTITNNANTGSGTATIGLSLDDSHYTIAAITIDDTPQVSLSTVSLDPGKSAVVTVRFALTALASEITTPTKTGSISFSVTDENGTCTAATSPLAQVNLTGHATLAVVGLSATTHDFGLVNCGALQEELPPPYVVTITNSGNVALDINNLAVDAPSFYTLQAAVNGGSYGAVGNPLVISPANEALVKVTPLKMPGYGDFDQVTDITNTARFTGIVTFTTNDALDVTAGVPTVHSVTFTMAPRGAILDAPLPGAWTSTWDFPGTVQGVTSIRGFGINNSGNQAVQMSLTVAFYPLVFGLAPYSSPPVIPVTPAGDPITIAVGTTQFYGTFTPDTYPGSWLDTATLHLTPGEGTALCYVASAWYEAAITLSGTSSAAPGH